VVPDQQYGTVSHKTGTKTLYRSVSAGAVEAVEASYRQESNSEARARKMRSPHCGYDDVHNLMIGASAWEKTVVLH
jgi:hypothetical protein